MRAWCLFSILTLTACDASVAGTDAGPRYDAGPLYDAGAVDAAVVMGDFDVFVEHAGLPVTDGGELPVEFGCQGGAHVELDVRSAADGAMRDATARVQVMGGPQPNDTTLRMEETSSGAEVLTMISPFGDFMSFVSPGDFAFPLAATVQVTVTARDGSAVTATRSVSLVMGSTCTCTYADPLPGTATVSSFTRTEGVDCELVQVGMDLAFTLDDPMAHLFWELPTHHDFEWPARCVDALMLGEGAEVRLDVLDAFPGQPCDPPIYYVGPNRDIVTCDCPRP